SPTRQSSPMTTGKPPMAEGPPGPPSHVLADLADQPQPGWPPRPPEPWHNPLLEPYLHAQIDTLRPDLLSAHRKRRQGRSDRRGWRDEVGVDGQVDLVGRPHHQGPVQQCIANMSVHVLAQLAREPYLELRHGGPLAVVMGADVA